VQSALQTSANSLGRRRISPDFTAVIPETLNWFYAQSFTMSKPYHEMTPAERLADRIAKNREIDQRVGDKKAVPAKKKASEPAQRSSAANNVLDKFQEIKRTQGIDAASEFVLARRK
jgi:hypothetical protein